MSVNDIGKGDAKFQSLSLQTYYVMVKRTYLFKLYQDLG